MPEALGDHPADVPEGVGLKLLWADLLAVALIAATLMTVSALRFRKTRE